MLAPIAPFMTEKVYQEIFKNKESIFLEDWPKVNKLKIDENLELGMCTALELIQEVLAQRDVAKIGVRWPLANVTITSPWAVVVKYT